MSALRELLVGRNESIPLDVAALGVASIEFPGLSAGPHLDRIDQIAQEIKVRLPDDSGESYLRVANEFLFGELGLTGNAEDYYNPRNSCLNEVIRTGMGIPITLSVLYMEVARRLDRKVSGIGAPGHFLVRYQDRHYAAFIDPFHAGRILTREQALQLASDTSGMDIQEIDPQMLAPATNRSIVIRMLNNLRAVYFRSRSYRKAVQVMDLLISADPMNPDGYRQRAMLYSQLFQWPNAKSDLERFLLLSTDEKARLEVEQSLRQMQRYLAGLN